MSYFFSNFKKLLYLKDCLRFKFNKLIYDYKSNVSADSLDYSKICHILILKIDGKLGDTQVITPFFTELAHYYSNIDCSVICSRNISSIYKNTLKLKNVFIVNKRPKRRDLSLVIKKINNIGKVDLLITLDEYLRGRDFFLIHSLRPTFVAGINNDVDFINIKLAKNNRVCHITEYIRELLIIGGISNPKIEYTSLSTKESVEKAKKYCRKKQIALAPWGSSIHKHLNTKVIIHIVNYIISNTDFNVALLLPKDGEEVVNEVFNNVDKNRLVKIPNTIDCHELASIIDFSEKIISVDTANVHMACASNIPILAFYNGNNLDLITRWAPLSKSKFIVFYKSGKMIDDLTFCDLELKLHEFLNLI